MKDYFYLNQSAMIELSKNLRGSEIKMLLAILYCMAVTDTHWFVNSTANRKLLSDAGFSKTPENICSLLSSLTRKGVLKREANGVYSVMENLIKLP